MVCLYFVTLALEAHTFSRLKDMFGSMLELVLCMLAFHACILRAIINIFGYVRNRKALLILYILEEIKRFSKKYKSRVKNLM